MTRRLTVDTTSVEAPKLFVSPEWDYRDGKWICPASVAFKDPLKTKHAYLDLDSMIALRDHLDMMIACHPRIRDEANQLMREQRADQENRRLLRELSEA